jgi:hypothetical protein
MVVSVLPTTFAAQQLWVPQMVVEELPSDAGLACLRPWIPPCVTTRVSTSRGRGVKSRRGNDLCGSWTTLTLGLRVVRVGVAFGAEPARSKCQ